MKASTDKQYTNIQGDWEALKDSTGGVCERTRDGQSDMGQLSDTDQLLYQIPACPNLTMEITGPWLL